MPGVRGAFCGWCQELGRYVKLTIAHRIMIPMFAIVIAKTAVNIRHHDRPELVGKNLIVLYRCTTFNGFQCAESVPAVSQLTAHGTNCSAHINRKQRCPSAVVPP